MWDGAAGIEAVWKHGGLTLVQDEITSQYFDMPAAALDPDAVPTSPHSLEDDPCADAS